MCKIYKCLYNECLIKKKRIEIIMNCLCVYDYFMRLKMLIILIDIKFFGKIWIIYELFLFDMLWF